MNTADRIADLCDADPADDVGDDPRMFSDLDDDRMSDALFKLWQKGMMHAEWDEEEEATRWALNEFGVELCERGLVRPYVYALEGEYEIDVGPDVLEAPKQ